MRLPVVLLNPALRARMPERMNAERSNISSARYLAKGAEVARRVALPMSLVKVESGFRFPK